MLKNNHSGQALVESALVSALFMTILLGLGVALSTATQILILHKKVNEALLCLLSNQSSKTCLQELELMKNHSDRAKSQFVLKIASIDFFQKSQRPGLQLKLIGCFGEKYEIKKNLDPKVWKL